jgi:integrase
MKAWLFQDHRQKERLGDDCPWSVGWIDPDGKRKSKRVGTHSSAEKHQRKIEGQLAAGTYETKSRKGWKEFREEYEAKILPRLAPRSGDAATQSLNAFQKHINPGRLSTITTATVDNFVSKRQGDTGNKPDSKVSAATINKDLRHVKAALRVAAEWGYLSKVPKCRMVREERRMGHVVTAEHFQAIYKACSKATVPDGQHFEPADWWRALLMFAIGTGWRIDEILSLKWEDVNLDTGAIITRAATNKGGRDDLDKLRPEIIEHLKTIKGFGPLVFYWPKSERRLWLAFHAIQKSAGINLVCPYADRHGNGKNCSDCCHYYGFHALRRGYATFNVGRMSAPVLQKKMRHKSFSTTLRYIELADKMAEATDAVFIPAVSAASG